MRMTNDRREIERTKAAWLPASACHCHGSCATVCGEENLRHTRHGKARRKKCGGGVNQTLSMCCGCHHCGVAKDGRQPNSLLVGVWMRRPLLELKDFDPNPPYSNKKGGPGASGRVLPPVTGRSRVRVAVSSHCTNTLP